MDTISNVADPKYIKRATSVESNIRSSLGIDSTENENEKGEDNYKSRRTAAAIFTSNVNRTRPLQNAGAHDGDGENKRTE